MGTNWNCGWALIRNVRGRQCLSPSFEFLSSNFNHPLLHDYFFLKNVHKHVLLRFLTFFVIVDGHQMELWVGVNRRWGSEQIGIV